MIFGMQMKPKTQREKFIEAAAKAEADKSEEAFKRRLAKIAKAHAPVERPKKK